MLRRPGRRLHLLCLPILAAVTACGEEGPTPSAPPEPDTVVSSIEVAPPKQTIGVLGTEFAVGASALNAAGETLYGSTQSPGRFQWSTSAPDVAALGTREHGPTGNQLPTVTGVGEGTATITATSQGLSDSMTVTVRDRARSAWSVSTGTGILQAAVTIGADGTIYVVATNDAAAMSRMLALSREGELQWTLALPRTSRSTPAMGEDGTLYLGSWSDSGFSGSLVAVHPRGAIRWVLEDLGPVTTSPAIAPDGTIYAAGGRNLYAVDPQGEIQWIYEHKERVFGGSSPAVASDGTIYLGGSNHGHLYAFNPDGSLRWTFETGNVVQSSPSIGADGTIYFGSHDGRVYAVHPDGTERWSLELRCGLPWGCLRVTSSPSIGPDGTVYVGVDGVYAVDPEGSVRWHFRTSQFSTTPLLGADGNVYLGTPSGITALDAQGNLLWAYGTEGRVGATPAIGPDGAIIAVSVSTTTPHVWEGTVQAMVETDPTNGGFDGAAWPVMRGDRANTGRAGDG